MFEEIIEDGDMSINARTLENKPLDTLADNRRMNR
jgi:hypothetical protein